MGLESGLLMADLIKIIRTDGGSKAKANVTGKTMIAASLFFVAWLGSNLIRDVVANCVLDCLKPINVIAQRVFHQFDLRIG